MSKELFISSLPHETKIAVMEDDNLVEVFYQRDTDVGLVGGIYKGRVSRVLPGMQSAFVDIGLERDAFLYVSDFFEDSDEYDRVATEAETRVGRYPAPEPVPDAAPEPAVTESNTESTATPPVAEVISAPEAEMQPAVEPPPASAPTSPSWSERTSSPARPGPSSGGSGSPSRWDDGRGRGRRRRRGRGFGGKYEPREHRASEHRPVESTPSPAGLELLPGESLAKYSHLHSQQTPSAGGEEEAGWEAAPAVDLTGPGSAGEPSTGPIAAEEHSEVQAAIDSIGLPEEDDARSWTETESRTAEGATATTSDSETGSSTLTAATSPSSSPDAPSESSKYRIEEELLAGSLRLASVPEPDAPKHGREVEQSADAAVGRAEAASPAIPGSDEASREPSSTYETQQSGNTPVIADAGQGAGGAAGEESSRPETEAVLEETESPLEEESEEVEEDSEEAEDEMEEEEEATEEAAEPALAATEPAQGATSEGAGENTNESGERSYTLRDSNQRPRFAPRRGRRGRGRFGRRGVRPETQGQRRPDHPRGGNEQAVQINEVLKEGQEILVQIAKEPLGTKGARITSHIALPGRYLVYMPTIQHIGVSRKIASEEERFRLRNLILEHRGSLTGGIIVRTAAAGRSDEELKADVDFLARLWNEIRSRSERSRAPALIHRDLTLVERILRDILSPDFKTVRVDNELEYQNVLDFVDRFQPSLVGHVKLYTRDTPIFDEFGIQAEIDKALKPKVWLKSGGYIVINQTEALVAIDVNTGKYVGRTNRLEDTIVKTNIDAVKEIVRQIRLRDLGGIIVIDFIDMDDRRNRMKVVQALEEALRTDRAPTKILSFNEFGLVALTRKRVKQSLERTLSEPCAYCGGSGWIKSVTTICYEILEEARQMAHEIDGKVVTLRVNPEVARALKSREGSLTAELESLTGKDVVIKSDPNVHQERFEIF